MGVDVKSMTFLTYARIKRYFPAQEDINMERKPNVANHHEQDITINRNQAENRAMWLALIFDELEPELGAEKTEALLRKAITKYGKVRAAAKKNLHGPIETPEKLSVGFASNLGQRTFEMDNIRYDESEMKVDFHYCALVSAWEKLGCSDERIALLCDIAMDGDRGFADELGFDLELSGTLANGCDICKLCFRKK